MALSILVFSSIGDEDFEATRNFAILYSAKFVDKLSSSLDDLILVANNKIVYTPTVIVLSNNKEVARMRNLPNRTFIDSIIASHRKD